MKNKSLWMLLMALLPLVYLAFIWSSVPAQVPLHYNLKMEVDRIGSKSELLWVACILVGVAIAAYLLLNNIHRLDPKRNNKSLSSTFKKLATGILIFITLINLIIIASSAGKIKPSINIIFCLTGVLLAFIGNYMYNIKPNYFAGFRLPWTLSNDDNWRRTHHLASKIWFAGGLLIAVLSFFLKTPIVFYTFIGLMIIMTLIPAIYSYRIFKGKS